MYYLFASQQEDDFETPCALFVEVVSTYEQAAQIMQEQEYTWGQLCVVTELGIELHAQWRVREEHCRYQRDGQELVGKVVRRGWLAGDTLHVMHCVYYRTEYAGPRWYRPSEVKSGVAVMYDGPVYHLTESWEDL